LRKKNKEVKGETTRDKYITHTESFSIQLKKIQPKKEGREKKTHTQDKDQSKSNFSSANKYTHTHTHTQPSCQGFDAEELERFL
jgi:hypothetical protein